MNIFNLEEFMPHGHCYMWRKDILLMNAGSDLIIAFCYLSIPIMLSYILWKRQDFPYKSIIIVFILFIFFCSLTHTMEIINVWYPLYYVSGIIKTMTAIISVVAASIIMYNLKRVLNLPSVQYLEKKIQNNMYNLMNKLPVGVLFTNKDGGINYVNHYVLEKFNYELNEIINKPVEILLPEKSRIPHIKLRDEYFKNPVEREMGNDRILKGVTSDNKNLDLEIGLRPIGSEISTTNNLIITIRDVSEENLFRKQLAEKAELVKIATKGMTSVLAYLDSNSIVRYQNDAHKEHWGKDLTGKHISDFVPKDVFETINNSIQSALSGETINVRVKMFSAANKLREFDANYIPHYSDDGKKINGVVLLAHDYTDLLETQNRLEIINKQLEEYAFLVSHDLRAPVRHIANFVDLLEEGIDKSVLTDEQLSYIDIIKTNSDKIHQMISGMLKLASISQLNLDYSEIDTSEFLTKIKDELENENVHLKLNLGNIKSFHSDRDLLRSIFLNLIQNSINHADKDKCEIGIEIQESKNNIVIFYQDNGPGINDKIKEKVFAPFFKTENSKGVGLGLNIVQRAVQRFGGDIIYLTNEKGALFKLTLPVK